MAINSEPPTGWIEVDLSAIKPGEDELPFRLVVNRFKSSSDDAERFIHDPRGYFQATGEGVPALQHVADDWHVSTFIINHHRTLSRVHVYAMAAVSDEEKTVGVTIYKKEG